MTLLTWKSCIGGAAMLLAASGGLLAEPALVYSVGGKFDGSFNEAAYRGAEGDSIRAWGDKEMYIQQWKKRERVRPAALSRVATGTHTNSALGEATEAPEQRGHRLEAPRVPKKVLREVSEDCMLSTMLKRLDDLESDQVEDELLKMMMKCPDMDITLSDDSDKKRFEKHPYVVESSMGKWLDVAQIKSFEGGGHRRILSRGQSPINCTAYLRGMIASSLLTQSRGVTAKDAKEAMVALQHLNDNFRSQGNSTPQERDSEGWASWLARKTKKLLTGVLKVSRDMLVGSGRTMQRDPMMALMITCGVLLAVHLGPTGKLHSVLSNLSSTYMWLSDATVTVTGGVWDFGQSRMPPLIAGGLKNLNGSTLLDMFSGMFNKSATSLVLLALLITLAHSGDDCLGIMSPTLKLMMFPVTQVSEKKNES